MYRKLLVCLLWLTLSGFYSPDNEAPTVFLLGDATVATFADRYAPMAGWGQDLHQFFTEEVSVDNRAIAGKSSRSYIEEGRWATVMRDIQAGDYVLIQFGHNDQKRDYRYSSPYGTYQEFLTRYVEETRQQGGIPVLITPVVQRRFDSQGNLYDTHGDYPDAVRQLASELDVPLIDLHQRSFTYVAQLGEEASQNIFLWLEPGETQNYPDGLQDNTNFCRNGAREIGRLVIQGLKEVDIPLKNYLKEYQVSCPQEESETVTVCLGDSVFLDGHYRSQPGTYRIDLGVQGTCRKTRVVSLTVSTPTTSFQTVTLCAGESIVLGGVARHTSGIYRHTYSNHQGCDSVVTTQLIVRPVSQTIKTASIYRGDSVWIGQQYRHEPGTYYDTLTSATGCDSLILTSLQVIPPPVVTEQTITLCDGDSLLAGGRYQRMNGTFYDTIASSSGYDSIVITTLQIGGSLPTPAVMADEHTLRSNIAGDTYRWFFNGKALATSTAALTPWQEGNYSVMVSRGQCVSSLSETYYHMPLVSSTAHNLSEKEPLRAYQAERHYLYIVTPRTSSFSSMLYIHDLAGNCVYQNTKLQHRDPLNRLIRIPFALPEGIYTVTWVEPGQSMSVKFCWTP